MDVRRYNSQAWDREVSSGSQWSIPVDADEVSRARTGDWSIKLTSTLPTPSAWLEPVAGQRILCLAGGGGQQGPILAAAGAIVTVFDNSPAQLAQDRLVADREGLTLELDEGDMADLSRYEDQSFDLIFNPASNCFVSDLAPVWRECFRVLKPGGALLVGHMNPAYYLFDFAQSQKGVLEVAYKLPFSDPTSLAPADLATLESDGTPYEFSHTLEILIGGQLAVGFQLSGFYEDKMSAEENDTLSKFMSTLFATRAVKP
ncbi:MAG: SAM-dependent methyltransferase [Candidatus Krumholzibacteriia bacterium]|jgi:SAM-dependent methyltransferase